MFEEDILLEEKSPEKTPAAEEEDLIQFEEKSEEVKETSPLELCLLCNLKDLFIKFGYDERKVLTPTMVRESLNKLTGQKEEKGF